MRILLTGKNGQVGWELQRSLPPLGNVIALSRDELDLASADAIRKTMRDIKPDIIVNAAAYTSVDRAETEADLAMAVNGTAPGIIAEEALRLGAFLVHYSTDYVFDGTKNGPYQEDDVPNPLNVYGRSKLEGEKAIRATNVPHYIFRTSWIYSAHGSNFVNTILRLAGKKSELKIVDDQIGAPTWARTIAIITAQALKTKPCTYSGLYHLTAAGAVSWFGFAKAILAEAKTMHPEMGVPQLIPITTSEYPLPAKRPSNSQLDNKLLFTTLGLTSPNWATTLPRCVREIMLRTARGPGNSLDE
jgi:dTDP-4-dehydrorhamnose reductase